MSILFFSINNICLSLRSFWFVNSSIRLRLSNDSYRRELCGCPWCFVGADDAGAIILCWLTDDFNNFFRLSNVRFDTWPLLNVFIADVCACCDGICNVDWRFPVGLRELSSLPSRLALSSPGESSWPLTPLARSDDGESALSDD